MGRSWLDFGEEKFWLLSCLQLWARNKKDFFLPLERNLNILARNLQDKTEPNEDQLSIFWLFFISDSPRSHQDQNLSAVPTLTKLFSSIRFQCRHIKRPIPNTSNVTSVTQSYFPQALAITGSTFFILADWPFQRHNNKCASIWTWAFADRSKIRILCFSRSSLLNGLWQKPFCLVPTNRGDDRRLSKRSYF